MPFEITPEPYVPPGTPVEPPNSTSFGIVPAPPPMQRDTDVFIQWQSGGYDLGKPDVLVVDFRFPLIATRGVGEHENVITVRRFIGPPPPPPPPQQFGYFTSAIYPFIVQDDMAVPVPRIVSSYMLPMTIENITVPVPTIQGGSLVVSINYLSYGPTIENLSVPVPLIQSGSLDVTIEYLSYGPTIENISVPVPTIQSASLTVTIEYIVYNNGLSFLTDNLGVPVPTIQSASLT